MLDDAFRAEYWLENFAEQRGRLLDDGQIGDDKDDPAELVASGVLQRETCHRECLPGTGRGS